MLTETLCPLDAFQTYAPMQHTRQLMVDALIVQINARLVLLTPVQPVLVVTIPLIIQMDHLIVLANAQ